MSNQLSDEEIRKKAQERVKDKKGFYTHMTVYLIVNAFLWLLWVFTMGSINMMPGWGMRGWIPWPLWVTVGWGIGLLFHCFGVFVFHSGWEEKEVQKEIDKMKKTGSQ
jgi:hypothetical protein